VSGERLGHVLRQIFDCALLWLCVSSRTNLNLFDVGMTGKQSQILMVILVQLFRKHVEERCLAIKLGFFNFAVWHHHVREPWLLRLSILISLIAA